MPPCEQFFFKVPKIDKKNSQNENLDIEDLIESQQNTSFVHQRSYKPTFKVSWKMGKKWIMHLKPQSDP